MKLPSFGERKRKLLLQRAEGDALRAHLAVPWPNRLLDVSDVPLLALDLETTGLDPMRDEIVSAAWVRVRDGRILLHSARQRTVRPEGNVAPASVVIHGISDDAAAAGIPLVTLLDELLPALSGAVLVAHNAPIEAAFLRAACQRCYGSEWAGPCIDTLALLHDTLQRRQQPIAQDALRLPAARQRFGLPTYPEHDALCDAIAAAELWLALAADLRGSGKLSLGRVRRVLP